MKLARTQTPSGDKRRELRFARVADAQGAKQNFSILADSSNSLLPSLRVSRSTRDSLASMRSEKSAKSQAIVREIGPKAVFSLGGGQL